jgi:hypothetical protein
MRPPDGPPFHHYEGFLSVSVFTVTCPGGEARSGKCRLHSSVSSCIASQRLIKYFEITPLWQVEGSFKGSSLAASTDLYFAFKHIIFLFM